MSDRALAIRWAVRVACVLSGKDVSDFQCRIDSCFRGTYKAQETWAMFAIQDTETVKGAGSER